MSHDINDTNPNQPTKLDMRLWAEEPPVQLDDTPPSGSTISLEERLRAEEPPIIAEDTNPSNITHKTLTDKRSGRKRGGNLQRAVVFIVLLGAVILTGIEAYLWLKSEDDTSDSKTVAAEESPAEADPIEAPAEIDSTVAPDPSVVQSPVEPATENMDQDADQDTNQAAAQTEQVRTVSAAPPVDQPAAQLTPQPTAAADEIAAALLAPVAVDPPANVIVRNSAPFTIRSATQRTAIIQYTVQSGDTLDSIAAKFDLSDIYTIIWSNPRNKYTTLQPGTQLTILPENGVYHEVTEPITIAALAETYGATPFDIIDADYNNLFGSLPETLIPPGMWIAVPGGESERVNFFAPVVQAASSGSSGSAGSGAGVISGTYNLWGCSSTISGGSPPASRPLQNYKFMQGFSLGYHEGVDLSGNIGDPIFASGSGTVAFAGWNDTGYGYIVVIAHGANFSLYAHMDTYNVRCGQSVSAGNVIGTVGNSGNSTGSHLHFEVRSANWDAISPMYIGF